MTFETAAVTQPGTRERELRAMMDEFAGHGAVASARSESQSFPKKVNALK